MRVVFRTADLFLTEAGCACGEGKGSGEKREEDLTQRTQRRGGGQALFFHLKFIFLTA